MRKFKRVIHKQFGGLGNFFAIILLVAITVIFINTYVLTKRTGKCSTFVSVSFHASSRDVTAAADEFPSEIPPEILPIRTPNQTAKPINPQPLVEPQRIKRPSVPEAGKRIYGRREGVVIVASRLWNWGDLLRWFNPLQSRVWRWIGKVADYLF